MIVELQADDKKRLQRLKRVLKITDQNVISKALEGLEQREQLKAEILKPAKGFLGMPESEANALALEEVRAVKNSSN
jgi:predicted transcriptional regulator